VGGLSLSHSMSPEPMPSSHDSVDCSVWLMSGWRSKLEIRSFSHGFALLTDSMLGHLRSDPT
jgi:hypothetical protein